MEVRYNYFACLVLIFELLFPCTFVKRIKITLQLRFVFVCHGDVLLLRHSYVIYSLKGLRFSELRGIMEVVGTYELCMEVTFKMFIF